MNNLVMLLGRTTADIELKQTTSGTYVSRFSLAVDRPGKDGGTDFINCVAFNGTAELVAKYVKKGNKIQVAGRIQTGSYKNKNGEKVYTTDIMVNSIEFCESKKIELCESKKQESTPYSPGGVQFEEQTPDDDLPF